MVGSVRFGAVRNPAQAPPNKEKAPGLISVPFLGDKCFSHGLSEINTKKEMIRKTYITIVMF